MSELRAAAELLRRGVVFIKVFVKLFVKGVHKVYVKVLVTVFVKVAVASRKTWSRGYPAGEHKIQKHKNIKTT